MNTVEHELDPFYIKANFGEDSVLKRIAKEGRLPSGTETDDALHLPRFEITREEHQPTAAISIAHRRSVGPSGTESRERDVLLKVLRLTLDAILVGDDWQLSHPQAVAVGVVLADAEPDDGSNRVVRQVRRDVVQLPIDASRMNVIAQAHTATQLDERNVRAVVADLIEVKRMTNDSSDVECHRERFIGRRCDVAVKLSHRNFYVGLFGVYKAVRS